ncbi:acetate--CoA ligase family protein [Nocardioides panzhihuensis]|uniref:Acyl-CoA synthetase (NDP forming) n=1 Tax=Nocardioides panzhihuensis TaxID=860243 RepID=A0A7Z0IQ88_9ACTN|nr:acetate--CoA ligase family protein [Nocardioides panzhihuensis]NYI75543.1 acyl-CoA synthetase (NDP forming) [Nocardioides panzhihuensis]
MNVEITPERLRSLFRPRNVALVGASNKSNFSLGTYTNLTNFGFGDRTFLVNARGAETHGQATYTSCQAIGEPVDLAHMMVPQAATLDALTESAAAGVRNSVVLSSGYGETGEEGTAAQAELVAHAESLDVALLGPNMLGFVNFVDGVSVMPGPVPVQPAGPVALLSQSGASAAAMSEFATTSGVGLSYMVTLGNEAMINAAHVIDFLVDDETTKAIALFLEAVRDPETFRRAALRAARAGKAIIVLKVGASDLSARSAAAHTGALVGDDKVVDAIFEKLGIIRVDTIEDMMITAGAAAHLGPLPTSGVGIVSFSGGACDILADRAADHGVSIPPLGDAAMESIGEIASAFGLVQNPLDVTGAAVIKPDMFTTAIVSMSKDPDIGVVAVVCPLPTATDTLPWRGMPMARAIGAGVELAECPVVWVNQVMVPSNATVRTVMEEVGVPYVIPGLSQSMIALGAIGRWSERLRELAASEEHENAPLALAATESRTGNWSEAEARRLLESAGIPVVPAVLATTADRATTAAEELGGAVALKIVSPDILHKSDIGGVRLGVSGHDAVREAYDAVIAAAESVPDAKVDGVLVSPMRRPAPELLVGVVRDPQWGPILAVAIGGVLVEVLDDSALSPLPVTPDKAKRMLRGLRASAVLDGVRGGVPADLDVLATVISRIGDLALALGDDLTSLEINPLRVEGDLIEALDAVVEWRTK